MNQRFKYEIGEKFNHLTLVGRLPRTIYSMFRCDCGVTSRHISCSVFRGRIKTCGCGQARSYGKHAIIHGMTRTPEYVCWVNMKNRCNNSSLPNYPDYGGRGITYCSEWESFDIFFRDMGYRPSRKHSLGRLDNDGNYEPSNCKWETKPEQECNKRNTARLCTGEPVQDFCKRLRVAPPNFYGLRAWNSMSNDETADYYMAKRGMLV